MIVQLTEAESQMCTWVGRQRFASARRDNRYGGLGPSADGDHHHIRGAHCEFATSIGLNLYWRPTIGEITGHDVGGLIDVRSTNLPDGRLIVKPEDDCNAPFVLAIARDSDLRTFHLAGWLFAWEAKAFPLLTCFGDPAHFVGQADLSKLEFLLVWIAEQRGGRFDDHDNVRHAAAHGRRR